MFVFTTCRSTLLTHFYPSTPSFYVCPTPLYTTPFCLPATSVGVKSAHRLGFWCAVPAALVGLVAGQRNGVYRYLGYTDNGNPTIYPGYVENSAPYFMRHEVSERHAPVAAQKLQ